MTRSKMRRSLSVVLSIVIPGVAIAASAPQVATKLPPPDHVSAETRAELRSRMGFHGQTMSSLVQAVVLLDRPSIRVLATRIADTEVVARTEEVSRAHRTLALPERYFLEQKHLAEAARNLAVTAAGDGDDAALADRFAALTRTCVGCHSAYLHGTPPALAPSK